MAKPTIQSRLIRALEARGYKRYINPRGSKYYEMIYAGDPTDARTLITGNHRLLLGKGGALRWTATSVANSHAMPELVEILLAEVPSTTRASKPD